MRLVITGIVASAAFTAIAPANAQGSWKPQASPSTTPTPVYAPPPAPPAPKPTKARPAMPSGNPGTWVTSADYPTEALRNSWEGTTGFRLEIDPTGKVTRCDITSSSGHPILDQTACRVMTERGTFTPALDAKGKPTTGSWSSRFRWVIPRTEPLVAIVPFTQVQSFVLEPDGSASECSETRDGKPYAFSEDQNFCGKGPVAEPILDAAGKPVRRKVTMTTTVTVTEPGAAQGQALPPQPPVAPPPGQKRPPRR